MSRDDTLGRPPAIDVEVVDDRTEGARCDVGFLRLRRLVLRNRYADGEVSEPYAYDLVEREAMDAVAIVLSAVDPAGARICLRSALRPPLSFRSGYALPLPDSAGPVLWEVPAGLVEPDERGEDGLRACATREALEEVGLVVPPSAFAFLGPPAALSPGVMGEKLHFLHAVVDPAAAGEPTLDGSPVEEQARVVFLPLEEALAATRDGRVADVKTEVAIHRLCTALSTGPNLPGGER